MEYINPIGEIGLVHNYSYKGDKKYAHTGLFTDKSEQRNYFYTHSDKYTNYQYNKERRSFVIGDTIRNISEYSYMWFSNDEYGRTNIFERKVYYCFITSIKYLNNGATEIQFDIDIIQTFLYDITVPPCLVEREHTLSDKLFEHIIPEEIKTDDAIDVGELDITYPKMLCGIIMNKRIPTKEWDFHIITEGGTEEDITVKQRFRETFSPTKYGDYQDYSDDVCGVPNSLYWYTGIPSDIGDVEYFVERENEYSLQPLSFYDENGNEVRVAETNYYFSCSVILNRIVSGEFDDLSEDNIVAVYMYPSIASLNTTISNGEANGYRGGVSTLIRGIDNEGDFRYIPARQDQSYIPKNNKLYTYPYSYLEAINNQGNKAIYKYENFFEIGDTYTHKYNFRVICNRTNPAIMMLVPLNYNGDFFCYDETLSITGFPEPYYSGDALNRYMQQNANKKNASMISSVLSGVGGAVGTAVTQNPLPAVSSGLQVVSSITQHIAVVGDLKNTPPQNYTVFNSDFMNVGIKKVGFTIKLKSIKAQFAKIIDDYFTAYGYKISEIKTPNVFMKLLDGNVKIRPKFNYLKTANCLVKTLSIDGGKMCDSNTLNAMADIFNNGITFWSDIENMGDYSLYNAPQSQN